MAINFPSTKGINGGDEEPSMGFNNTPVAVATAGLTKLGDAFGNVAKASDEMIAAAQKFETELPAKLAELAHFKGGLIKFEPETKMSLLPPLDPQPKIEVDVDIAAQKYMLYYTHPETVINLPIPYSKMEDYTADTEAFKADVKEDLMSYMADQVSVAIDKHVLEYFTKPEKG